MSGSSIGSVIGSAIGYYFGGPAGAQIGWMVGGAVGGAIDPEKGPKLEDLKAQGSEYGRPIPIVYGTAGVAGNVIWASDLVEEEGEGGKGGGGPVPYVYFANFAVALCEGEVSLGRIWAGPDKRLIWDGFKLEGSEAGAVMRFYRGTETQMPDPLIESYEGVGNVPAYRGTAYVVFEHFPVEKDGNRIPFLTCEVGHIIPNTGPENIGSAWIQQVLLTDTFYAVLYNGSYEGVIIRSYTPASIAQEDGSLLVVDSFLKHFTYPAEQWSTADQWFWDKDRQVFVLTRGAEGGYYTINYSNGLRTFHAISAVGGAEPDAAPASNVIDGVYHNDTYVFIAKGGSGKRVTLFLMDPVAHTPLATYTSTLNGDVVAPLMKPNDASAFVYANNGAGGNFVRYGVSPSAAAVVIGAAPPNWMTAEVKGVGVDPATGFVWAMAQTTNASGATSELRVLDPATQTLKFTHTHASGMQMQPRPPTFIPGAPGKVGFYGQGGYLGACDAALLYNGGAIPGFIGETITSFTSGGYAGTSDIHSVHYNPVTLGLTAIRRNGFVSPGTTLDPVTSLNWMMPNTWLQAPDTWYLADGDGNVAPQGQPLSEVVKDLSKRAGLTDAQINVASLEDDIVDGYVVTSQVSVQGALSVLLPAYFFDIVESGGVAKAVKRGGPLAVVVPDEDLGAYDSGSESAERLVTTRLMENELPRIMNVNYILEATSYSTAIKHAIRLVGASGEQASLQLPIVMTDTKAQQVAEVNLHSQWVARISYKFSLPRKYSYLEPTDIIQVQDYTVRITRITQSDGVLKCEAVHDESNVYLPRVIVTETPPLAEEVFEPSPTTMEMLNINMFRDSDNDAGFWVAACASDPTDTWRGAEVWRSIDGGASYTFLASIPNESVMGIVTNALGNFWGGNIVDEHNYINVALRHGTLSSTTPDGLLAGTNACVVGDEIIYFRTATLEANGSYTLRGLLRGRRGSEYAMESHVVTDRFVLLDTVNLVRIAQTTADIGLARLYKPVSGGATVLATIEQSFTNQGTGLECYSCVHLGGGRNAAGDALLKWVRRTRISGEWRDLVDVPVSEASESYEVEIWDAGFVTLKRTISGLTAQSTTYTAADQTTDFGAPQATVYFRVYQLSANVGRGYVASGSI